jgi:hypothetical protein
MIERVIAVLANEANRVSADIAPLVQVAILDLVFLRDGQTAVSMVCDGVEYGVVLRRTHITILCFILVSHKVTVDAIIDLQLLAYLFTRESVIRDY